jgi:hypothetical protein
MEFRQHWEKLGCVNLVDAFLTEYPDIFPPGSIYTSADSFYWQTNYSNLDFWLGFYRRECYAQSQQNLFTIHDDFDIHAIKYIKFHHFLVAFMEKFTFDTKFIRYYRRFARSRATKDELRLKNYLIDWFDDWYEDVYMHTDYSLRITNEMLVDLSLPVSIGDVTYQLPPPALMSMFLFQRIPKPIGVTDWAVYRFMHIYDSLTFELNDFNLSDLTHFGKDKGHRYHKCIWPPVFKYSLFNGRELRQANGDISIADCANSKFYDNWVLCKTRQKRERSIRRMNTILPPLTSKNFPSKWRVFNACMRFARKIIRGSITEDYRAVVVSRNEELSRRALEVAPIPQQPEWLPPYANEQAVPHGYAVTHHPLVGAWVVHYNGDFVTLTSNDPFSVDEPAQPTEGL